MGVRFPPLAPIKLSISKEFFHMPNISKSEVKTLSSVERELSIVISGDSIRRELDRAYQRLGSQVKINGFRQGKVPRSILEQRYRADVEKDVLNDLLTKSFH